MSLHPDASTTLAAEVARFRVWADTLPKLQRSAEWESDYPEWQRLYEAVAMQLAHPFQSWTDDDKANVLFAMARDNEAELLVEQAALMPDVFLRLAATATQSSERDARWQIAAQLGSVETAMRSQAEAMLMTFVKDDDTYVRRRALTALVSMKSLCAEEVATRLWQNGDEQERVTCLHALAAISSDQLQMYLELADRTGQRLLAQAAQEIATGNHPT